MLKYTIDMPENLMFEIRKIATERGMETIDVLRQFISLGLLLVQSENDPDMDILVRRGEDISTLVFK